MYFHVLEQSRCQDMSSESAGLDEIGSIFCHLDQWIVSALKKNGQKEKEKEKKTVQEDTSVGGESITGSCCLLWTDGRGRCQSAGHCGLTSVEDHQELFVLIHYFVITSMRTVEDHSDWKIKIT